MRRVVILLIVMTLAGSASATDETLGAAGAQFLKIGVGSRYQAMGEASVAMATDVYAAYWNPAGLAEVETWSVGFTSVNWLLDVDLNYVAMARYFEDVGVFAISASILSMDEQEITTVAQQDGTGQFYTASSYAIGLSFARQLTHRFAFGGTLKFIGEDIGVVGSRGFGLDFGTLMYTGFKTLRLGVSITNMGPELKFTGSALKVDYDDQNGAGVNAPVEAELSTTPYDLPMTFRMGMAYDVDFGPNSMLTLATELKHPSDSDQKGSIGAEFGYQERYFLRGGYKINYDEETFALGAGMIAPLGDSRLVIDYSWQDFGRLDAAQRFSVGFTF